MISYDAIVSILVSIITTLSIVVGVYYSKSKISSMIQDSISTINDYLYHIENKHMQELSKLLDMVKDKYDNEYVEINKKTFIRQTNNLVHKYICNIEYNLFLIYDIFDKILDKRDIVYRLGIDKDTLETIELCRNEVKNTIRVYDDLNRKLLRYYNLERAQEMINSYTRIYHYFMTK